MVILVLGNSKRALTAREVACAVAILDAYHVKVEDYRWQSFEELLGKVREVLEELDREGIVSDP